MHLQKKKKKMSVIYLMGKYVIEMVNDDEEMPQRRNNSGKGAIELMTEEVIDIKEQIRSFLELLTSSAAVWNMWELLSNILLGCTNRLLPLKRREITCYRITPLSG